MSDPDNGPWKCGYFGLVWTGDITNHHGIDPPAFCPGPHTRDEMGPLLRRLHEGWRLRRDGSLAPPPLPDLRERLTALFDGGDLHEYVPCEACESEVPLSLAHLYQSAGVYICDGCRRAQAAHFGRQP